MMLSKEQAEFLARAHSGHNIVLTGQGGTGKTFIVKSLVHELSSQGKNIAITATTGIAATQFTNGTTIHRWCGLGDGSTSVHELCLLVDKDEKYLQVRKRIQQCHVLIIDECSMLSQKLFETVELICRTVKRKDSYFGGIQIILVGDFYQLPPVPEELYGETGKFCFQSSFFKNAVPHIITLKTVFRQTNVEFINCINEIERGILSERSKAFIKKLERDIPVTQTTVYLFAKNFKCKLFNHDKLKEMDGDLKIYQSEDEGDRFYLSKFQAPPTLGLKVNCPVMLVVNLSDKLVNGLRGTVVELGTDHVTVHFPSVNQTVRLDRHMFTKVDPENKICLAKRHQFPLILSFGITIHKSQGLTLESVVIDCEDARIPGQIGVALSRAQSVENLQVKNFKFSLVTEHPTCVTRFYENEQSDIFHQSLICCQGEFLARDTIDDLFIPFDIDSYNVEVDTGSEDSDADSDQDSRSEALSVEENIEEDTAYGPSPFPNYLVPEDLLKEALEEYSETPVEKNINAFGKEILKNKAKYLEWLSGQFLVVKKIANSNFNDGEVGQQKQVTNFCTQINTHLKSIQYFESCKHLISLYPEDVQQNGQSLCTSLVFKIQSVELNQKASLIKTSDIQERLLPSGKSDEGRGNIRYIGGYCVAKLKYKYQKQVQSSLYDPKKKFS